jgi:hypothetical protein
MNILDKYEDVFFFFAKPNTDTDVDTCIHTLTPINTRMHILPYEHL